MKHDKQRDLARMVLPSRAAKMARDESRHIHRQERHHVRECLATMAPDDEWEDARHYTSVSRAESFSRSEMLMRVSDRRGADNLGGLRRWAEHQKKLCSGDDAKAYEKCAEVLKPSQNLITKHAMSHVAGWLDAPQARFYRPMMNERDLAAEQENTRRSMHENYGPVIMTEAEMRTLLERLYSCQHAGLNKILKQHNLMLRSCTEDDPCITKRSRSVRHYYVFDVNAWQKWRKVSMYEWDTATRAGTKVQTRTMMEEDTLHDINKCANRIIIRGPKDIEVLYDRLCSAPVREGGRYTQYSGTSETTKHSIHHDIIKLAERSGLR
ncbi:MAG: hypothetical protein ACRDHN_01365 [Thermomicrobiales bacterium]